MSVHLPDWPLEIVRAVAEERGVQVWPVGGVVRDGLLNRPTHDWDFAVDQDAMDLARAVGDALGGAYFPLDKERDTGRVVLTLEDDQRLEIDFAGLRGPNLDADLQARDFTINAMAVGPEGELIDPTGGYADLQASRVRAIGPSAFDADPLRMLRAIRQVAELGMRLEAKTAAWIGQRAALLAQPSAERVRDEFVRILLAPAVADHVHMLDDLGLLPRIVPEVMPLKGQTQSPPHRFDVWWHTLLVVEGVEALVAVLTGGDVPPLHYVDAPAHVWDDARRALGRFGPTLVRHLEESLTGARPRRCLLLLAALCHDLGKPLTCSEDEDGRLHFYSHGPEGATMTAERMQALRFGRAEVKWVERAVRAHLRPGHLARVEGPVTRRAIYRFFRATGDAGVDVVLLGLADHLATWGPNLRVTRWERRLEVADLLLSHYFERYEESVDPPPIISGRDLMEELGLESGPLLGKMLAAVREAQAAGEVDSREEALALVERLLDS